MINISKFKTCKIGRTVLPSYTIVLHLRDKDLLLDIKSFFKEVGNMHENYNTIHYNVRKLDDIINIVIPHFDKYPLITQKRNDYIIFKNIIELINNGKHLNVEGLLKIISLKANLNKGLSEKLKMHFLI
jgi:hypothetical protein